MSKVLSSAFWRLMVKTIFFVAPIMLALIFGAYHLNWWLAANAGWSLPRALLVGLLIPIVLLLFNAIAGNEYRTLVAETAARKAEKRG